MIDVTESINGGKHMVLAEKQCVYCSPGYTHSRPAPGRGLREIIEVQHSAYLADDFLRIDSMYSRL